MRWPRRHKDRLEVPGTIPEHERPVGRIVADAHGGSYGAFRSLGEAKEADTAAVIMEGDDGGSIYLTCPARLVNCDEATLRRLLLDLDALDWKDPDSAGIYYERVLVGAIPGGTGGGVVTEGVWLHPNVEAGRSRGRRGRARRSTPEHLTSA
jgi:hypothetical protein